MSSRNCLMRKVRHSKNKIKRRRCWAVTKNFRRCNTQRTQLLFCREHSQLKYIIPVGIAIFTLMSGLASIESAWIRPGLSPYFKRSGNGSANTNKVGEASNASSIAMIEDDRGPFAIQPLWLYGKPPTPKFGAHDGADMMDGFELILAMRILNRTDKQILIDDFQYTWRILNLVSSYEGLNKTDLITQTYLDPSSGSQLTLREILEEVQGGYLHSSAIKPLGLMKLSTF